MENVIQLKKRDTIKIGILDENGKDTGEYLEFDFNDIEYPLLINKCTIEHQKNINVSRMKFLAVDKKEDKEGKYALTKNQEEKLKILNEFYNKEMEVLDMILGKGGCKKMLNGRKPYYEMFDDIVEALEPIMPILEKKVNNINDKIREKYKGFNEDGGVIE